MRYIKYSHIILIGFILVIIFLACIKKEPVVTQTSEGEIPDQEIKIIAFETPLINRFHEPLGRDDHQDAEQVGDHQSFQSGRNVLFRGPGAQREPCGGAGQQEKRRHGPLVNEVKQQGETFVSGFIFHVPAHVIEKVRAV